MVIDMEIKYKQLVIVPKKPKMSKGKIASQVAHATFMALEKQKKIIKQTLTPSGDDGDKCCASYCEWDNINEWKNTGMCVIVLECKSQIELMNISKYCEQWKIPHHLYIDEGITEIPMGTATTLATGVLSEDKHWIFDTMKLFKG